MRKDQNEAISQTNNIHLKEKVMTFSPLFTEPSVEEMNARKAKVLALMANSALDCFVITDPDNIYWLTHFANYVHERPFVLILSNNGKFTFVIPKLEVLHVQHRVIGDVSLVTYEEFPYVEHASWDTVFKDQLVSLNRIGIEEIAPHYVISAIGDRVFPSEFVEQARYVKSDYEISRIIYSSNIANKAMEKLLKMAKPGLSALSVHSKLTKLMSLQVLADNPEMNALATNIAAIVQPPNVSHDPHNFTNLMDMDMAYGGPHISIINGTMNGYGTEVERTFFLGKVPEKAVKPYQVMMEARQLCFDMCKPGVDMHDVDSKVFELFSKHGYGENIVHRTGHSIGVTGHEGPFLAKGFHYEIQENMLFTVEPGIYIEGIGGFRHSDTVLITSNGCQSLTPIKDSLSDMTLSARKPIFSFSANTKQKLLKTVNKVVGLNV